MSLQRLSAKLGAYARLCRYPRQIGTALLVLPFYCGAALYAPSTAAALGDSLLMTYGAFMARSAGCALNDWWDAPFDGHVQRTKLRPVATGEVSRGEAFAVGAAHAALGSLVFLWLPRGTLLLAWALGLGGCLYPAAKRLVARPQLLLAPFMNAPFLLACQLYGVGVTAGSAGFFAAMMAWTVVYDTVYAFQDVREDTRLGLGSTARTWRADPTSALDRCAAFLSFSLLAGLCAEQGPLLGLLAWAGVVAATRGSFAFAQFDFEDRRRCGEYFARSYRFFLWLCLALLACRLWRGDRPGLSLSGTSAPSARGDAPVPAGREGGGL